jgi:hypothetical protein
MNQLMDRFHVLRMDTIPEETESTADIDIHPASRRGGSSLDIYRILANYLVARRQHRTCANLNATNRSIYRSTLPILFRVVTLRYGWSSSDSVASWTQQIFLPLCSSRGARYIQLVDHFQWYKADSLQISY